MNLSKITSSVASFLTIMSLSTCAVAGTSDIMKKQLLQQLKYFQLSQSQHGKTLQKVASGSKEITVVDSVQTYTWENPFWEKSGGSRYTYDSNGRIKEEIIVDGNDGYDSKNSFEYDVDGKTVKNTLISNFSVDGEFLMSDTTYSITKYYPGYTNKMIQSDLSENTVLLDIEDAAGLYDLDSIVTITFDGAMDSTYKSVTKYTKISDKSGRANTKFTSIADGYGSIDYHTDYITSGNGMLDTTKFIIHFDGGEDGLYKEFLAKMQYSIYVSRTSQVRLTEVTALTATDSTFTNCTGVYKMSFYTNSNGDIDSMVTQEWDTLAQVWEKSVKAVYTLKKITVGVEKSANKYQTVQQITSEWKNGTLYLTIPSDVTVSVIEEIDLQGKVISRVAVTNAKKSITLSPASKNSGSVNLVRLKTDRGDFTWKISSVK
jgi:hypothetical protein